MSTWRIPITLAWTGSSGSPGVNVWHGRDDGLSGDVQEVVDLLHAFYTDVSTPTGTTGTIYQVGTRISLGTITNVDTQEIKSATWADIVTIGSGTAEPPANQICVSWRTSLAARRGYGRTFIGPLSSQAVDASGTVEDSVLNHIRTAAQNLVSSSMGLGNGAIGVYGRQTKGSTAKVLRDITGSSVRDQIAVLRSRRD